MAKQLSTLIFNKMKFSDCKKSRTWLNFIEVWSALRNIKRHTNRSSQRRVSHTNAPDAKPGSVARLSRKIIKHFTAYVIFLYLFHYET
jgi:hypothetical protein